MCCCGSTNLIKLVAKFTGRLRGDCCGCCLQHPPGPLPRGRWCFHPLPYILLSNRHQAATTLARNGETLSWEKKTAESIKHTACCFSTRRRRRCSKCRTTPPWTHTQLLSRYRNHYHHHHAKPQLCYVDRLPTQIRFHLLGASFFPRIRNHNTLTQNNGSEFVANFSKDIHDNKPSQIQNPWISKTSTDSAELRFASFWKPTKQNGGKEGE